MRHDGESLGRWPGSMTLSPEFFSTLLEHAVPLGDQAVEALQGSAPALDVYAWLAQRLCRVRQPGSVKLSWRNNLRDQFRQSTPSRKISRKSLRRPS